ELPEGGEEDLLHHVVGGIRLAHHPVRHRMQAASVRPIELLERREISGTAAGGQPDVGGVTRHWHLRRGPEGKRCRAVRKKTRPPRRWFDQRQRSRLNPRIRRPTTTTPSATSRRAFSASWPP